MRAFAELSEEGNRINVHFPYSTEAKDAVKGIPGARFVPAEKGGPHWALPLDLVSARELRERFGGGLQLGDAIREWGRQAVDKERNLRNLATLDDVPLSELKLAEKLPDLAEWLRPYQRADVKFMASTNCLNLLQPRLGKTVEVIGAIYEDDLEDGQHLIVAPMTSLELIWRYEFERWTDIPIFTYWGELSGTARAMMMGELIELVLAEQPFVFATTADMVRRGLPQPMNGNFQWSSFTIDEYHKTGLAETKNKFPKAAGQISALRKWALSGTPMGGKPIKLWGGLHWLEPQQYTSKWRWAEQWLEVTSDTVYTRNGPKNVKKIGGLKKGTEDKFYASIAPHAVRRLRSEVLPQIPEKLFISVPCAMTKKQAKQYDQFAADAEIRIDEYHLSATSVLAEYTRLKQFANSYCEVDSYKEREDGSVELKLRATTESGKLPHLMAKLAEIGIDPDDPEGDAQAIVASQFKETADMVYDALTEAGIRCGKITGDVKGKARTEAALSFRTDGYSGDDLQVMVMTTTAGGVALTLDRCESVHVLDETWNPDDQEQLTDRAINTATLHQVTVFVYRSQETIEQYIQRVNFDKAALNKEILDLRRQGFRATGAK